MASASLDSTQEYTAPHQPVARSTMTSNALGAYLVNYSLVLIFLWFGFLKFTQFEAGGIAPLIMNSPLVGWWHSVFGIAGAAKVVGTVEIIAGLLIAVRPFTPKLAVIGGALAVITFVITISFMVSTPGVVQPGFSSPLALSPFPGQFLLKDVVLLAVSIWVLLGARAEAAARHG